MGSARTKPKHEVGREWVAGRTGILRSEMAEQQDQQKRLTHARSLRFRRREQGQRKALKSAGET
jgi:hypothetical protein